MTTFAHCAGHGCPIRDTCAKYRNRWNAPLGTLHWCGIAQGVCKWFEEKSGREEAIG